MIHFKKLFLSFLSVLHKCYAFFSTQAGKLFPGIASLWNEMRLAAIDDKKTTITHYTNGNTVKLSFYTPNALTRYRAVSFSVKEPDTLQWIDRYAKKGDVFFDIGANVGLYSIYYAKTKQGNTYAFEPSVFNLKLLAKNINLNGSQDRINIIGNPLTSHSSFADFNLQNIAEGGALSSFGVDYGHDGKKMNTRVSYRTLGFSLDYLIEQKIISEIPSLIKIDVDGIEHLILRGAVKTIADPICRSILIEVNDAFTELASEVDSILQNTGFTLVEKRSIDFDASEPGGNYTFNQIWIKEN